MASTRSRQRSSKQRDGSESNQPETDRYRQAAEDALQQLDWAIGYLHGIKKDKEARALSANRRIIRERILERPAEPLPDER